MADIRVRQNGVLTEFDRQFVPGVTGDSLIPDGSLPLVQNSGNKNSKVLANLSRYYFKAMRSYNLNKTGISDEAFQKSKKISVRR